MRHLFPYLLFYLFRISYISITFFPLPQLHQDASLPAYLPNSMSFLSPETKQNKTTKFNLPLYWPTIPGHWACHIIWLIYLMLLHCINLLSSKEVSIANSWLRLRLYIHFPFSHCLFCLCWTCSNFVCAVTVPVKFVHNYDCDYCVWMVLFPENVSAPPPNTHRSLSLEWRGVIIYPM